MFVDFNKVFNSKPQTQLKVPEAVVNYMSNQLPDGIGYVLDDSGNLSIDVKGGKSVIGGFSFRPTDEDKRILGKNFTEEDITKYFYNAQKPIPLTLKREGYITINGTELPIEKLSFDPYNPIKYVKGSLCMLPHHFPEPFMMEIGNEKYKRKLSVSRIPNRSINEMKFESLKDEPLYIRFIVDEKNKDFKLSLSYNLKYANSISDIIESTTIYNSYLEGNGYLNGHQINVPVEHKTGNGFDKKSIEFWEKVLKLEERLNVRFVPPKEDIDFKTLCIVEHLYQNIVNRSPIRDKDVIDSINGEWEIKEGDIQNTISQKSSVYFEFEATYDVDLFGVKTQLPALIGIFNAIVSNYDAEEGVTKITLEDMADDKKRYTSIMYFVTENELNEFKQGNHNERINLLQNAKKVSEYLV